MYQTWSGYSLVQQVVFLQYLVHFICRVRTLKLLTSKDLLFHFIKWLKWIQPPNILRWSAFANWKKTIIARNDGWKNEDRGGRKQYTVSEMCYFFSFYRPFPWQTPPLLADFCLRSRWWSDQRYHMTRKMFPTALLHKMSVQNQSSPWAQSWWLQPLCCHQTCQQISDQSQASLFEDQCKAVQ